MDEGGGDDEEVGDERCFGEDPERYLYPRLGKPGTG